MSEEALLQEEEKARKELNRAHRAKLVFDNELFKEAVDAVKQSIWEQFVSVDPTDTGKLQVIRMRLDALDGVLKGLRTHIETGKLAETTLQTVMRRLSRLRDGRGS